MGNMKSQRYEIFITDPIAIPAEVRYWIDSYIKNDHDYHAGEENLYDFMEKNGVKENFKIEGNCETAYPGYLTKYAKAQKQIPGIKSLSITLHYWDEDYVYYFCFEEPTGWLLEEEKCAVA